MSHGDQGSRGRGMLPDPALDAARGTATETITETTTETTTQAARPSRGTFGMAVECPFHTVMRQVAEAAVLQHVLHLEGEVLPRRNLVDDLECWQQVYRLVRTRVCPATREAPLLPDVRETLLDVALPYLLPTDTPQSLQARLVWQIAACARCSSSQECPLGLVSCTDQPGAGPAQEHP